MLKKKDSEINRAGTDTAVYLCRMPAGDRILAAGTGGGAKKAVTRGLQSLCALWKTNFEVLEQPDAEQSKAWTDMVRPEDYVIFVPEFPQVEERTGRTLWKQLLLLSDELENIRSRRPKAVLLLSDTAVYGKVFGTPHALKEDEIGYVCHTDPKDTAAQCMRTVEHLCSRLAREEGFPVKIARADWSRILEVYAAGEKNDGAHESRRADTRMEALSESMIRILMKGTPGEAYNLPGVSECEETERKLSPLSPIPVVPDSGKAGML